MNNLFSYTITCVMILLFTSCTWDVVDSDGLLITDNDEAYIAAFDLVGTDNRSVLVSTEIDEDDKTVYAVARFGTDLTNVKPYSSVALDALVVPAMGHFIDFSEPREYTVISGNRKIENTYTIYVTVEE